MGCMALLQLVHQIFNSPIQVVVLELDSFAMDPSIALKIATFLLSVASVHDFRMSCFLGVL